MKKVMISILILIPVLILVIVAMVSGIVSLQAWIAVDNIELTYKDGEIEAETLSYSFDEVANKNLNIYDYVDVKVYPEKAKNYTIEWRVSGEISYTDEKYESEYKRYLAQLSALKADLEEEFSRNGEFADADKQSAYESVKTKYSNDTTKLLDAMARILIPEVKPALAFVDGEGNVASSNTSGDFVICSYCHGTIEVVVENIKKTLLISVGGDNVKTVTIGNIGSDESNTIEVGQSKRITASYTPIDSIVNYTIWHALDEDIATIDQNGVITAKKAGVARFTMDASVHSTDKSGNIQYVKSNEYTIEVKSSGASEIFGTKVLTHNRKFKFEDLGIADYSSIDGATIDADGYITIGEGNDIAVIVTPKGNFTIEVCDENAFTIVHADLFAKDSGYVLAVGEHTLKLNVAWASSFKSGTPDGVVWTSDNEDVATVSQQGEVTGVGNGLATICATYEGVSVTLLLNVQKKIASIQLRTSDASLAVGLARESVFATYKYVNSDVSVNDAVETNFVDIIVLGEPKRTSDMSDATYEEALKAFYDSYVFEIVGDKGYARFDDTVKNRLVFNPDALEGKGKQAIVVKVSAKYPKYDGMTKFTSEEVTINAIYGVSVYNVAQLEHAAKYQRKYSEFDEFNAMNKALNSGKTYETRNGNLQPATLVFSHTVEETEESYVVYESPYSLRTYAIVLMANCDYGEGVDTENIKKLSPVKDRLNFFGDVYGNNKMICAITGQLSSELMRVSWSNVTISNVILRGNDIIEEGSMTADDTKAFTGYIGTVGSHHDWNKYRLTNVKFEYCIIENARQGISSNNSDISYVGCIMRNFLQCGMYVHQKMTWQDDFDAYVPFYSHISFHNFICSNMVGSVMSATYERLTITDDRENRFVIDGSEDENTQYYLQNFASKGINLEINQTGFFNAYNWQDLSTANIIDTGNEDYNSMIGRLAGGLIMDNKSFAPYRYQEGNQYWYHLAFIVSGISIDKGITDEPTFAKVTLSDPNMGYIRMGDIDDDVDNGGAMVKNLFSTLYIFGYKNNATITPHSGYVINADLISSLH